MVGRAIGWVAGIAFIGSVFYLSAHTYTDYVSTNNLYSALNSRGIPVKAVLDSCQDGGGTPGATRILCQLTYRYHGAPYTVSVDDPASLFPNTTAGVPAVVIIDPRNPANASTRYDLSHAVGGHVSNLLAAVGESLFAFLCLALAAYNKFGPRIRRRRSAPRPAPAV
jgi:hypothetical protein